MTERYSFAVDRHLVPNISVDGSVVWNQDNMDGINSSLTDTMNEGYVTAEEDTQYLSVLDSSNEISLENLNITLTNPKLEVEETAENFITSDDLIEHPSEEINEQVVVYTVEGSDELFGIQIAQDEDGNLQKYQFQFRKNKDGQLEAIPETIQLLPMEEVIQEESNPGSLEQDDESATEEIINEHRAMHIFVQEDNSDEHILPDNSVLEGQEENEEHEDTTVLYEPENIEEETVDIKPGILTLQSVKQEIQEHQPEFDPEEEVEEETTESFPENLEQENVTDFHASTENIHEESDENHIIEYTDHLDQNSITSEVNSNLSEPMNNGMNIEYVEKVANSESSYVKETHMIEQENSENFEHVEINPDMEVTPAEENAAESQEELDEFNNDNENNMNDSDVDDYHIVEGVHITGDVEAGNDVPVEPEVSVEKPLPTSINNTNILRHALKTNKEPRIKKDNRLYLYVVQHPEKENVDSLSLEMSNLCKPMKANPRSILKSSHAMFQAKNDNETFQHQEERLSKRFARCKEAMQARIFHNFINKTTIPQAPIRKNRLPRKQKIKPVERMDEEIVVQEVMVSSNGFMEAVGEGFNKENLEVTEYVELTDSDDDYDPKRVNKKKKKHKRKKIEITISDDSDVSHDSVIELDESDDEINQHKEQEVPKSANGDVALNSSPMKRRRGRPPKNRKLSSSESQTKSESESPLKKIRVEPSENLEKPEIPCPKCDKTFPSQNSLKTHLQHHSLQSSLKNALPEYKYKCDDCGNAFKNGILLKKHVCLKRFSCSICTKKFPDASSLNAHKRTHAKKQLIKNTTIARVSPKKVKPVPSAENFKSPRKINNLKCKTCGKLCSSMQNLNVHMKTHREYVCTTCSAKFGSQLLLEKHVRESCVKSPRNNRKSMKIKNAGSEASIKSRTPTKPTPVGLKVNCDKCSLQFVTHKALFKHKVLKHGLETPDKTILQKGGAEKLRTENFYGGVPAGNRLKNVYADVKCRLDFKK